MTPEERAIMEEYVRRNKSKPPASVLPMQPTPQQDVQRENIFNPYSWGTSPEAIGGVGNKIPRTGEEVSAMNRGNFQGQIPEEQGVTYPDFLPGMVEPANLVPVGGAIAAGAGIARGLAAKGLEKSLKFIPAAAGEMASQAVGSVAPKVAAVTASPAYNKLTQAALPNEQYDWNFLKNSGRLFINDKLTPEGRIAYLKGIIERNPLDIREIKYITGELPWPKKQAMQGMNKEEWGKALEVADNVYIVDKSKGYYGLGQTTISYPKVFEGKFSTFMGKDVSEPITQAALPESTEGLNLYQQGVDTVTNAAKEGLNLFQQGVGNAKDKLLASLKEAKMKRSELDRMYGVTRRENAAAMAKMQAESTGESTVYKIMGYLKGKPLAESPPDFKPLRNSLTQMDINELVQQVDASKLLPYQKLTANEGLLKIINGGKIPQPSEMTLIKDVFGADTVSEILKMRPWKNKMIDIITSASNLPRALMASADASAPLRQGLIMTVSHPKLAAQAFKESWKQTFNPERYAEWISSLKSNPLYQLMDDSGLYVADPSRQASGLAGLAGKEEKYMTDTVVNYQWLKEKLPSLGPIIERAVNMGLAPIRASERNYTSYLNKLRVDSFGQLASRFIEKGLIPEENMDLYKHLATFINSATGRGSMQGWQRSAQLLNTVFFSPRLIKARIDMFKYYMPGTNIPWEVRKEALIDMTKTIGAGLTFLGLMKLGGANIETDPTSSDFMKARIGNTRIDPWGGNQQLVKLAARLYSNERKTASGRRAKLEDVGSDRWEEIKKFFSYKIAPTPALMIEAISGKKTMGEKFDYLPEEKILPMVYQDMKEVASENPNLLFFTTPLSFFGMGVQTYKPKPTF